MSSVGKLVADLKSLNVPIYRPRGSGDIVSTGFSILRERLTQFLKISLVGYLWSVLISLAILALIGIFALNLGLATLGLTSEIPFETNDFTLLGSSEIIFIIYLAIACPFFFQPLSWRQGFIEYMTFNSLSQGSTDETKIFRRIYFKSWSLVWTSLLVGSITLLPLIISAILLLVFSCFSGLNNPIPLVLIAAILSLISLIGFVYVNSRLLVTSVAMVMENLSTDEALRRSWKLTEGNSARCFGVIILAFLPFMAIITFVATAEVIAGNILAVSVPDFSINYVVYTLICLALELTSYTGGFALTTTTYAVLYYELRARKEGLDLIQRLGD